MKNSAIRQFVRRELRAVTMGVAATAIGMGGGLPAAMASGLTGGTVVSGQGSITNPNATTTLINQQSSSLILNWSTFNVAGNETVRFVQPSSTSVALNNILSASPSQIFGRIDANGRVVLINPNGILFGRTAQLNVGSLIASSLELKEYDPATGHLSFQSLSGNPGLIDNEGTITAGRGGSVALLGGTVLNNGLVLADYGTVAMGAGQVATLDFYGGGLLRLQVSGDVKTNSSGAAAAVQNNGQIQADGGQVVLTANATQDVFASAVNNTGVIRANRIENVGGVIQLSGPDGVVANSGTLDASGTGANSTGGTVTVTGNDVGLFGTSTINASGPAGGGTVLVGGGFHGTNADVADASHTYVGADTTIDADATQSGNGGDVAVWSNDGTRYYGSVSARGAGQGSGGYTEVSGKGYLDYQGQVDLQAPAGKTGTLLLDPIEITIEHGTTDTTIAVAGAPNGPFTDTSNGAGSILSDGTINTQLTSANVTVTTSAGDIVISGAGVAIAPTTANTNTLTLNSAANISWDSGWSYANNGQLTLYAAGGSISTNATGQAIALGGTSPLLMQASTGIGTSLVPIETTGLTSVAATNGTGGIYISNSGSGDVTVSSLTNPISPATPVAGLSVSGSNISLVNTAGAITVSQAIAAGSAAVTLNSAGTISESGSGVVTATSGLTTTSVGGTTLGGANAVGSFDATNSTSGNVSLTNGAALTIAGITQSGGGSVSVTNAGGTTLTGAVGAGAGSVTLKDTSGALALGTNNVSGGGVTLQGVGVTQSAASTVNAGSGDILVNGGGGAVSMAGALTTTSTTTTAATVQNATTVALPAITTGTTGTTTIGAGDISGAVTQSGSTTISTGTLTGSTHGTVNLGNGNSIATIGAFASTGFTLDDGSLNITGTLAGASGGVDLVSTGTISESGSGLISGLGLLRTSSVGGTTLGGSNAVGSFNATNTGSGSVSLTNAATLTITGISQSGGGSLSVNNSGGTTLTGVVNAGAGSVTLKDTTGSLALGANNVSGAAGVTLQGKGITQSAGSTVNAGSGDIAVNGGGGAVLMAGALTTTSNTATAATVQNATTVNLPAITTGATGTTTIGAGDISGPVTQSGSTAISTGTLTGDTSGSVLLANATVPTVGAFTSNGFILSDGDSLSIAGALANGAGNVTLSSSGTIAETGSGLISTTGMLKTTSVGGTSLGGSNVVSTFDATNSGAGSVSLSNGAATTLTITGLSQTGGGLVSVTNTGAITFANTNSADGGLSVTSSNGGVTLGSAGTDSLSVSGGPLSVTSDGSITQQGGSSVTASSTQLTLNSPTGDVVLKNAAAMGTLTLTRTGHNLDLESTTQSQINSMLTGDTWATVTVVDSGAAISLPSFTATAGLAVTASGISQSAGAIAVTGATTLSSAGNPISLNNAGNSFSGNVAFTGSSVTLASSGALSSSGTATGSLSETAGGTISEGGTITVAAGNTASFTVNGATADVDLGNAANNFNGDAMTIQTSGGGVIGNVTVADTNATFVALTLPATLTNLTLSDPHAAISLPGTTLGGALDVTAGGAITQTGALSVQGNATVDAGANPVTLDNAGNSFFGNVAFTGTTVTLTALGGLSSSGTATGSLSETAGGTISEGGPITVGAGNTATFTVNGGTGDVNLGNPGNNFNGDATTITTSAGGTIANVVVADANTTFVPLTLPATLIDLTLSDPNAPITVAGETIAGTLDVSAGGSISQSGALVVNGTTVLAAGGGAGDITLSNAGNALTGGINVTGHNVTVVNTAGTTIAGTSTASSLTLDAGGAVAFGTAGSDSTSVTNGLVVQGLSGSGAAGGAVSQVGALSVGTTTSIDAGTNSITLANASNALGGPITLTGGAVTLANSEGTTLAGANSAASLTLDAGGAVTFGTTGTDTTTVTNGLIVQGLSGSGATGGAVSQSGSLSVGGATAIDAGTRAITLANAANALTGPVTLIGGAVTLANAGATTFGGASNVGSLTLDAGGVVSETGTLSVSGTSNLDAGGNAITLGSSGNSFGGNVAFTGAAVTLASNGALSSSGTATGTLTETAAGAITQGGVLNVTGVSTLTSTGGDITLGQANTFGGNVAFSGRNVTLTAGTGGLSSSGTATGTLTEVAAGSITQGGALSVTGNTTLTANGGGNITLANSGNAFAGLITLTGGAVTLANADAMTLGGANNASSLTLNAGGGVAFGNAGTDSTTVANNLVVQGVSGSGAAGGAVSEVGTLSVGGTTSIDTGGHDITLLQANTFTGDVNFTGQNVSLSTSSGSLTSSGTAGGNLVERAEGASANLNIGSLSAGGEVLLIAGNSILGTSNQATVTANNVIARYGLENVNGQIGGTNPSQQVGFLSASGSQVHLTIWLPAPGTQFQNSDLRQTASDLLITRDPFGQGEQSLLYSTNLGLTPAEVAGTLGSIQSTLQGSSSQSAGVAQGAATQGTGSVLYIDWASYNPNVSLFGTLNPAVCLPADQRDESGGAGSGSGCGAASASLLKAPAPIRVAMVPTRDGWRAMPLFYLAQ